MNDGSNQGSGQASESLGCVGIIGVVLLAFWVTTKTPNAIWALLAFFVVLIVGLAIVKFSMEFLEEFPYSGAVAWIFTGMVVLWLFNSCSAPSKPDYTAREAYDVAAPFAKKQLLNPVAGKGGPNIVTVGSCRLPPGMYWQPFKPGEPQTVFPNPVDKGCSVFITLFAQDSTGVSRAIIECQITLDYDPETKTWKEYMLGSSMKVSIPGCLG